jgi:hypothetical protein
MRRTNLTNNQLKTLTPVEEAKALQLWVWEPDIIPTIPNFSNLKTTRYAYYAASVRSSSNGCVHWVVFKEFHTTCLERTDMETHKPYGSGRYLFTETEPWVEFALKRDADTWCFSYNKDLQEKIKNEIHITQRWEAELCSQ